MSETSCAERACLGCFREEIRGVERSAIRPPSECDWKTRIIIRISKGRKIALLNKRNFLMNTLTAAPLAPLIDRLFATDAASRKAPHANRAQIPAEQRAAMMSSKTDYRALYTTMKDTPLAVSRATA